MALAGLAGIFATHIPLDIKRGGHILELFRHLFANPLFVAVTIRTGLVLLGRLDLKGLTRQIVR